MRYPRLSYVLPLLVAPFAGCQGCLGLDDYSLVPSDGAPPRRDSAGGSGGTSGAGGDAGESCAGDDFRGTLFANFRADETMTGPDACPPVASGPGIDVVALDPENGACLARARIAALGGAEFDALPRIAHSLDPTAVVAGTFRGGSLELPLRCQSSTSVVLAAAPRMTAALFVARLRLEGSVLCTEWARRAWTEDAAGAAALRVHGAELSTEGSVAIVGALGGVIARFEGQADVADALGGAFLATWSPSGALRGVHALAFGSTSDALFQVTAAQSSWLATGTALVEDPDCHACAGISHVTDRAHSCGATPDAGADGGDASSAGGSDGGIEAGSAGAGGAAGGAGSGGAPNPPDALPPDAPNALLVSTSSDALCSRFESFGSDRRVDDLQAGRDVALWDDACGGYLTGLAGRDAWRFVGSDPKTALAAGSDDVPDGFLARFDGGSPFGCPTGGPAWTVRLQGAGSVSGERVAAARCADRVAAMALVQNTTAASLSLSRCNAEGACQSAPQDVPLAATVTDQLVVLGMAGDGTLGWHTALGPVRLASDAPDDPLQRRPRADMALDQLDHVYVIVETTEPLQVFNVEPACAVDASAPAAMTSIIALERSGSLDKGSCRWVVRR